MFSKETTDRNGAKKLNKVNISDSMLNEMPAKQLRKQIRRIMTQKRPLSKADKSRSQKVLQKLQDEHQPGPITYAYDMQSTIGNRVN